jgi:hypothetical protein
MTSRYEFRVPGWLSDRPLVAFPDMAVVEAASETIIYGNGVLALIQDLPLDLVVPARGAAPRSPPSR